MSAAGSSGRTKARSKVVVLISGRGSNMLSLLDAHDDPSFPAEIVAVIANRPDAGGLAKAAARNVATAVVDHKHYSNREAFERELDGVIRSYEPNLVCLAGFMRILTPWFVDSWRGKLLNIHPSLLPLFRGTHTHRQALDAGVRIHGCTVHFVVPELDAGPIIAQAAVPVLPDDTEDSLADRVLAQEHTLYPQALASVARGEARLEGAKVAFDRASNT